MEADDDENLSLQYAMMGFVIGICILLYKEVRVNIYDFE